MEGQYNPPQQQFTQPGYVQPQPGYAQPYQPYQQPQNNYMMPVQEGQGQLNSYYIPPQDPFEELGRGYLAFYKVACLIFTILLSLSFIFSLLGAFIIFAQPMDPYYNPNYILCLRLAAICDVVGSLCGAVGCVTGYLANTGRDAKKGKMAIVFLAGGMVIIFISHIIMGLGFGTLPQYVITGAVKMGVFGGCVLLGAIKTNQILEKVSGANNANFLDSSAYLP
jgi:hypothetical protein